MEMPTERVDLRGNNWAELYVEMKRITARLHEAEIRKHMRPLDETPMLASELRSEARKWPEDFVIDTAAVDSGRVAEHYMLHQVKEWSFGPVDQATIDDMPKHAFDELRAEIDRRYVPNPLPASGGNG